MVDGVDVANASDQDIAAIDAAWGQYGVLFFRDQHLEPEQHLAFAKRFADVDVNKFFKKVDGHPEIAQVLKEADQTHNIGGGWHTDHSYDTAPARGSILLCHEVPPAGGDTMFASVGAAYDALSDGFKEILSGLQARHTNEHVFGRASAYQRDMGDRLSNPDGVGSAIHPVIIRHPDTGRKLLYVNPGFTVAIDGWNVKESRALLDYLFQHISSAPFHLRFAWEPGSIAMWDNRSTWHYALNDYAGHRRLMHRVTIAGVELAA